MDKEEIMTRLAGYRPEIYRDDDPQIAKALLLARADPELSAWLDEQIDFDRSFAQALGSSPSNHEELEKLLADAPPSRHRFRAPRGVLLAAAALLLFGGFAVKFFLFPAPVEFPAAPASSVASFRDHMAYFANKRFVLDETISDLEEARRWLAGQSLPIYDRTPDSLAGHEAMGCKAIDWRGTKVALLCFLNDQQEIVHLFIVDESQLSAEGAAELAQLRRDRNLETRGWQEGGRVHLLVGSEPHVSLAGLL